MSAPPPLPTPGAGREQALLLRMSDGVRLDASFVEPDGAAPTAGWPAVLLVHGHGEDGSKASTLERGRRLARRGIAALCLTVRGQGASEGLSFHLGARELFDLLEVIDALMARPEVDAERVAVCGSSQGGWHAWMAACFHPRVRTAVPENIFVDYADFAVPAGALSTWFFTRTMRRRVMSAGLQDMARQWALSGEWHRLRAWLSPMSPAVHVARIRCPVLVVHGWHDRGMPANPILATLEQVRAPWGLILGGGGHDGEDAARARTEREARVDAWLDHHLLGLGPPPPRREVRWTVRPGWEEHSAPALAPERWERVFLRQDGRLATEPETSAVPNLNITHVPRDPSYDLAAALHRDLAGSEVAWPREEVLFRGPALEGPLELRGAARFTLHLLAEQPWLQVHAELWDEAPDGSATRIAGGHWGTRSAEPGRHLRVEIEARAMAWRLPRGHRLLVKIADQEPGSVLPEYRAYRGRLFADPDRPSAVELPVAEGSGLDGNVDSHGTGRGE